MARAVPTNPGEFRSVEFLLGLGKTKRSLRGESNWNGTRTDGDIVLGLRAETDYNSQEMHGPMTREAPTACFCLMALTMALSPVAAQTPSPTKPEVSDQAGALREAFQSAGGNPQALMQNLEGFLTRFPRSPQREQVLQILFREALQNNDPEKAMEAGGRLLELNPVDAQLLSTLVDLLDRLRDPSSRHRALQYATLLIEHAEAAGPPKRDVPPDSRELQSLLQASGYMLRGKIYEKSGDNEKALTDYEKSYAAQPTAQVAERLGDLEAKRGDLSGAIDDYAAAFVFPETRADPNHQAQLRKKLGSVYEAKFHSERGLGDLLLARYDELMRTWRPRFPGRSAPNAGVRDPYEFALERLDGSTVRLRDFQGKVVVVDFWATWCVPCRMEGKLLARVQEAFRQERGAVFLAASTDAERSGVPAFVKEEQWTLPVVYAEGLDRLLGVRALPTLLIFDPRGRVVFRAEGLDASSFEQTVEKKLREALERSK